MFIKLHGACDGTPMYFNLDDWSCVYRPEPDNDTYTSIFSKTDIPRRYDVTETPEEIESALASHGLLITVGSRVTE